MAENAGTDVLKGLRVFSLPASARWILLSLLITLGTINAALFFMGLLQTGKHEWVKASLELMSVIMPFLLLAVVLFFSSSVSEQAIRRTAKFLLISAPASFASLLEEDVPFRDAERTLGKALLVPNKIVGVRIRYSPGSVCTDYILDIPASARKSSDHLRMYLRLELNLRRLTVNIGINGDNLPAGLERQSEGSSINWFQNVFPNTIAGASCKIDESVSNSHMKFRAGYTFNRFIKREMDGATVLCFVATQDLSNDFLWDTAEQLFVLNDLVFMLRAMLIENAAVFNIKNKLEIDDETKLQ